MWNNDHYEFVNEPLPYDYDALEPYIDTKTMHLHHDRHLQTYVDNLNKALKPYEELHKMTLKEMLSCPQALPECARTAILNNAGGVYNHRFYFEGMGRHKGVLPCGRLMVAIYQDFQSYEGFTKKMKEAALKVFGSGYAWLVSNRCGQLKIITTANQDSPLVDGLLPILTIDVWEHAYYLKHYNERAKYIDDWFQVIDWEVAERRYQR